MATKDPTATGGEPAIGIPYYPAPPAGGHGNYYYAPPPNPYAAGMPPPNAIYAGAPKGVPLQQTMFRDTPAPFHCQACGEAAVSTVRRSISELALKRNVRTSYLASAEMELASLVPLNRSKPSLASVVACMMPFMLGVCFLCPSMDCLWHKYHYCPSCGDKVGLLPAHHALFSLETILLPGFFIHHVCRTLQVGEFRKSDPCLVVDATRWSEPSFAVPA
ncbi:hypothetical protein HU200_043563 [Digitaria exilis]|uniref:LITAF domain-containing protein n=1 Tax=Digitaria exilis TaxID=1010633 RepID=A0A835EC07_9POAL|nr:hypothetical protein HU200_043563 [Digitaria exilis]